MKINATTVYYRQQDPNIIGKKAVNYDNITIDAILIKYDPNIIINYGTSHITTKSLEFGYNCEVTLNPQSTIICQTATCGENCIITYSGNTINDQTSLWLLDAGCTIGLEALSSIECQELTFGDNCVVTATESSITAETLSFGSGCVINLDDLSSIRCTTLTFGDNCTITSNGSTINATSCLLGSGCVINLNSQSSIISTTLTFGQNCNLISNNSTMNITTSWVQQSGCVTTLTDQTNVTCPTLTFATNCNMHLFNTSTLTSSMIIGGESKQTDKIDGSTNSIVYYKKILKVGVTGVTTIKI